MEEILAYIRAKERKNEVAEIEAIKAKFKDKNIDEIIKKMLGEGLVYEARKGILRDLG